MNFFIIELIHKLLPSSFIFYKIFFACAAGCQNAGLALYLHRIFKRSWQMGAWLVQYIYLLMDSSWHLCSCAPDIVEEASYDHPVPCRCHRSWMEGRKIIGKKLNAVFLFTAVVNIDQINEIVNLLCFGFSPCL